jgi:hypothetical protein
MHLDFYDIPEKIKIFRKNKLICLMYVPLLLSYCLKHLVFSCYVILIHLKILSCVAFTQRVRLPSLSRMVTGCALFFCVSKV